MGGNEFEKEDIYCQLIFPSFPSLSQGDRDQHLEYIRDKMYKQAKLNNSGIFLTNLENLRCLEVDNRLLKISDFCDHKVKLFQVFPEGLNFLSERYHGNEWLAFFHDLGLKTKVTVDEYIDYCQLVSLGKCKDISSASDTLVEYLFSNKAKVWYKNFTKMSEIGNISFVKVSAVPSSSWIRPPCQPPHLIAPLSIRLAKFNECVISKYAPIVWTVKPVFEILENYYDFEVILRSLGVILHPTVQDVYQNIINISETNLSNFELFEKYNSKYTKCQHDQKNVSIEQVMIKNLQYLYDNSQSYFKKLKSVPCIPVSAVDSAFSIPLNYPVLVKPLQVVHVLQLASTSTSSFSLRPYISPLPHHLTGIYHCLETIGMNQVVGLDNIQCMLETIHKYYGTQLGPNELKYVRHAVQTMHDLLKECCKNATDKDAAAKLLDPLYLPCREGTQWKLHRSTELVFVDHCRYDDVQSLASLLIAGTDYSLFLLPPDASHVPVRNRMTEKDVSLMIPKQIRPKSFAINSNEDILDDLRPGTDDCHGVKRFNFFKSIKNQLHDILPKVIVAKLDNCNEDEAKKFIALVLEIFSKMKIVPINGLNVRVSFTLHSPPVPSEIVKANFSFQNKAAGCRLFIDSSASVTRAMMIELIQVLCLDIARTESKHPTVYFKFRNPLAKCLGKLEDSASLKHLTEKYGIEVDEGFSIDEGEYGTINPVLGKQIPDCFTYMLDCDVDNIFRPQEWVGFEQTENNFYWAIVLYPIFNESLVGTIARKYRVLLDEDEPEGIEVSSLDLYKLVILRQQSSESFSTALELYSNVPRPVDHPASTGSLLSLKIEIYEKLQKVIKLPEKERKKAIKRLFFTYHPDTSRVRKEEKELYEQAFKYLNRQVDLLDNGLPLEDPKKPEENSSPPSSRYASHYPEWAETVRRRSRRFRERQNAPAFDFTSEATASDFCSYGFTIHPQPNPDEAKRWIRQARSDHKAMIILKQALTSQDPPICQIMFLAHKVAEKALKAAMYKLIGLGDSSLKSHEIASLANALVSHHKNLSALPALASRLSDWYLKPRFPNTHPKPSAPVDVYAVDDAARAYEDATNLLHAIETLQFLL